MAKENAASRRLRSMAVLRDSWRVIRENGPSSGCTATRREILEFEGYLDRNLKKLQRELQTSSFKFSPSKGVRVRKAGKSTFRPIVVGPVRNRIVQRAILDIVQDIPAIQNQLRSGFNCGGVPEDPTGPNKFGVGGAIRRVVQASHRGGFCIRSDIRQFFVGVPREMATKQITVHIADQEFVHLLEQATRTEIANLAELGTDIKDFPIEEKGVAQGSCLSPLLCNLLLDDFDREMNVRDVECIRYIDDFIIFVPTAGIARAALKRAIRHLRKLGLDAYDPNTPEGKAKSEQGSPANGIAFLGCEMKSGIVRPSRKKQRELYQKIDQIFAFALAEMSNPTRAQKTHQTFSEVTYKASHTVRAWGNTYSFCTDDRLFETMDHELADRFHKFVENVKRCSKRSANDRDRRRLAGFFPLVDCEKDLEMRNLLAAFKVEDANRMSRS